LNIPQKEQDIQTSGKYDDSLDDLIISASDETGSEQSMGHSI
jgi:hypothetical protein